MSRCQHCGQGAIAKDINGPVCPDCWDEGRYETANPMTNETEAPELLPCPFCGGGNLKFNFEDIDGWIAHVCCLDCDDMMGPMSAYKYEVQDEAKEDAAILWNTRADLSDAILALPETAGWTALEAATEELVNAEATIANLTEIVSAAEALVRAHAHPQHQALASLINAHRAAQTADNGEGV